MDYQFQFPPVDGQNLVPATCEEVQITIDALKRIDLRTSTIDELKVLIAALFQGYTISTPILDSGLCIYRIRPFLKEKPEFISALGAPPTSAVLRDQRCNRSGESMFYCSSARQTPFFELRAQIGDRFVLSEWKTTRKLLVNNVGYTPTAFGSLRSNRDVPTWGEPPETVWTMPVNTAIHEFLAEKFTQEVSVGNEHLYKLTIAVTEKLIRGGPFDGLLYPTIAMKGNSDNLSLTPVCASTALEFVKAEYLQIATVDGMQMSLNVFDSASALREDGAIIWKGHPDRWTLKNVGDTLHLSAEDGRWVARDFSGHIVDPD